MEAVGAADPGKDCHMNISASTTTLTRLDVPYGGGPTESLCVDIYSPSATGLYPALLCLHGGAWQHGYQRQYQSWGPWLAERGFVLVAVDYRLSQVNPGWPGVWHDVCRSLDWIIANASSLQIDPHESRRSEIRSVPIWQRCSRSMKERRHTFAPWSVSTASTTYRNGGV